MLLVHSISNIDIKGMLRQHLIPDSAVNPAELKILLRIICIDQFLHLTPYQLIDGNINPYPDNIFPLDLLNLFLHLLIDLKHLPRLVIHNLSKLRDLQRPGLSADQLPAYFFLKLRDLLTDCRLR